jgi:hypothetical protein
MIELIKIGLGIIGFFYTVQIGVVTGLFMVGYFNSKKKIKKSYIPLWPIYDIIRRQWNELKD